MFIYGKKHTWRKHIWQAVNEIKSKYIKIISFAGLPLGLSGDNFSLNGPSTKQRG
jgi:hypothetical protein